MELSHNMVKLRLLALILGCITVQAVILCAFDDSHFSGLDEQNSQPPLLFGDDSLHRRVR